MATPQDDEIEAEYQSTIDGKLKEKGSALAPPPLVTASQKCISTFEGAHHRRATLTAGCRRRRPTPTRLPSVPGADAYAHLVA
jgi:hypothetical protein